MAGLLAGVADGALAEPLSRSIAPRARPGDYRKAAVASVDGLIAKAGLSGKVGFVVADARTGLVLEARNPSVPMPPASTAKVPTALYALSALGSGYRFRTQLIATGSVQGGSLAGDLVLVGGGDPVLNTDQLGDLAARLKAAGVREVLGKFRYYAGALPQVASIDPGQPDHVGYNPSISGLNLNFNRVHFEWRRASSGWDVSMDARAERFRPQVSVARMKIVNRQVPVFTYSDGKGVDDWTVASGALGKGGSRWLPVRKPAAYAAEVFQTLARGQGVAMPRASEMTNPPRGTVLAQTQSPELRVILRDMLKYSTNMTAEVVGMTATGTATGRPASLSASASKMSTWLRETLGMTQAKFVDHSGLGEQSRVSPGDMVRALVKVGPDGALRPILKELSMLDAKGKAVKGHPARIRAKTGTLNFVSALAGYVTAEDGTELAFTIFAADEGRRAKIARSDRERPEGASGWNRRARILQMQLIDRWSTLYGS
ncbi:D-alanyl-D-alanine carboxypeptidase/D-alanyl-D-alanine endopeptidase [Actibacterium lipolyticum]|uniref:D-alanyl-D-alanine carboxypeptidase DacB n=1 Tax=Actibacterium lipolyticum TaxID=1524263 RepID=A0A238JM96_9RHOB|nr:D-alanyl-D-alanine carboxypeptidase/D-alanyl-D-alanine-endopeptidase [Actibacterium lipolyticum]SMX31543.1 D-alanyl-D-alanine carboxypeptidase DacB precursor [Actibacterium lipolyticum]